MMPLLDAEERAILESVDLGEWQSVVDVAQEIERYQRYAQAQINALESVRVVLTWSDLQALREAAQQSGTSVSMLMAAVLHQFVLSRQK